MGHDRKNAVDTFEYRLFDPFRDTLWLKRRLDENHLQAEKQKPGKPLWLSRLSQAQSRLKFNGGILTSLVS